VRQVTETTVPDRAGDRSEPNHSLRKRVVDLGFWLIQVSGGLVYWSLLLLISRLPVKWSFAIVRRLARLIYPLQRRRYERTIRALGPRLGLSAAEADHVLQCHLEHAKCEDLEACLVARLPKQGLQDLIQIRGLENLQEALSQGKGAILYSGHCRGTPMLGVALSLSGYQINFVHTFEFPGRPEERIRHWLYLYYDRLRKGFLNRKFGIRFLMISSAGNPTAALQAARALRRNELVTVLLDSFIPFTDRDVEVDFLNRRETVPSGPAVLAKLTGAPLLSYYVYRTEAWVPQIAEIGPPTYASEDLMGTLQHCVSALERQILQHPASWGAWLYPQSMFERDSDGH